MEGFRSKDQGVRLHHVVDVTSNNRHILMFTVLLYDFNFGGLNLLEPRLMAYRFDCIFNFFFDWIGLDSSSSVRVGLDPIFVLRTGAKTLRKPAD